MTTVLLLAGTSEATEIAARLHHKTEVVSSLAGVTRTPRLRPGRVRVGGFGGIGGLTDYLRREQIDVLIDATHPFAARMPFHAAAAAAAADVPRCRVVRAPWRPADRDRWLEVASIDRAPDAVRSLGAHRVLLTVGRQSARAFGSADDLEIVARSIEVPDGLPPRTTVVLDRGPFTVDDEVRLLVEHQIEVIVAKNSGGDATSAKLVAARSLGVPVVMVARPPQPVGTVVETVDDAVVWLEAVTGLSSR